MQLLTHPIRDIDRNINKPKKWTVFTYHSPRIRKLTNLFKHTGIGIAFRSTNTIQKLTKQKPQNHTQEHNKNGDYKLTCNTCKLAYTGQTRKSIVASRCLH